MNDRRKWRKGGAMRGLIAFYSFRLRGILGRFRTLGISVVPAAVVVPPIQLDEQL